MAVKDASAAFTMRSDILPVTGLLQIRQGDFNDSLGSIHAVSNPTWTQAPTWEDFSSYQGEPLPIIWTSDVQDLGEVKYFTLDIQTRAQGFVEYYTIYVSETGLFTGEETEYRINNDNYNIPGFYGRYYAVQVRVSGTDLYSMEMTASSETKTIKLTNVSTSTLTGSASARTLSLNYPVSAIMDIDIKIKTTTPYIPNLYVSDTNSSVALIPVVVSKSSTAPQIALYGIDNEPRDGIVDVTITALPRMVMFAGNITVIY